MLDELIGCRGRLPPSLDVANRGALAHGFGGVMTDRNVARSLRARSAPRVPPAAHLVFTVRCSIGWIPRVWPRSTPRGSCRSRRPPLARTPSPPDHPGRCHSTDGARPVARYALTVHASISLPTAWAVVSACGRGGEERMSKCWSGGRVPYRLSGDPAAGVLRPGRWNPFLDLLEEWSGDRGDPCSRRPSSPRPARPLDPAGRLGRVLRARIRGDEGPRRLRSVSHGPWDRRAGATPPGFLGVLVARSQITDAVGPWCSNLRDAETAYESGEVLVRARGDGVRPLDAAQELATTDGCGSGRNILESSAYWAARDDRSMPPSPRSPMVSRGAPPGRSGEEVLDDASATGLDGSPWSRWPICAV